MTFQFDLPLQELFVGRQSELEILHRELIGAATKFVCISGPGGMGKTSLAMMFAETNLDYFSGGVYRCHATSFEGVDVTVNRQVKKNNQPYLIIIDDLEMRPPDKIDHELFFIRQNFSNARLLATTRFAPTSTIFDLQLKLSGLSQAESHELLQTRLHYSSSSQDTYEMYKALMGHPLAIRLAVDLLKKEDITPRELLLKLQSFTWSGLVDSLGAEVPKESQTHSQIIADVTSVSDDFLIKLHKIRNFFMNLPLEDLRSWLQNFLEGSITTSH